MDQIIQSIGEGGGAFVYLSHCVPRPLCISLKLRVHISSAKEVLTTPQNGNIESTKAWFLLVLCSSSAVHVVVWNFITVPWNGSCQRHSEQSHFVCAWLLQSPLLHRYHTATAPPIIIDLYLYCITLILSLRPGHTGPSAQWDCNRIGQPNPSTCWSPVIQVHSLLHCSLHEIWCYFLRKASSYSAVLPDLCWNTCLQYVFTLHDRIKKN